MPVTWNIYGAQTHKSLRQGEVICHWSGTHGVLVCTEETWALIESNDDAITVMQEAQEEAKSAMPKAVVRDVQNGAPSVPRPVAAPGRPRRPQQANDLHALSAQIKALVEDMSRQTEPSLTTQAEFARRYGALRDRMKKMRDEISEVEGAFEIAQNQIVRFLNG